VCKKQAGFTAGLTLEISAALVLVCVSPAFALHTADNFGVEDSSGYKDTYVVVPVNITNVQNGPVICIIFNIAYDKNVINVVDVQQGDLTSTWDPPTFNNNFDGGTRVLIVYDDGQTPHVIQNGSTGSVAILTFSVVGTPGSTSWMNLSDIQLAENATYNVGTASAKNGTFFILKTSNAPTGGGTGVGGGGTAASALPSGVTEVATTPEGEVISTVTAHSPDGKASITIPAGTIAKDTAGNPLTKVTITLPSALPAGVPSGVEYVGYVIQLEPGGATFSQPVEISITFEPTDFPPGTTPVIYVYEAGEWKALETTIRGNKATAKVDHFSVCVLFAKEAVPTPIPTPEVTPLATPALTPVPAPMSNPPFPVIRMNVVIAIFIAVVIVAVAYMVLRER